MSTIDVPCVEVCDGEKLIGYAIFFSGGWEAYVASLGGNLICIARNLANRDLAELCVMGMEGGQQ